MKTKFKRLLEQQLGEGNQRITGTSGTTTEWLGELEEMAQTVQNLSITIGETNEYYSVGFSNIDGMDNKTENKLEKLCDNLDAAINKVHKAISKLK